MKNIFFTLNNIRGLRRYLKLKKALKKYDFNIHLITPSLTTFLTAKMLNKEVILSTPINFKITGLKNLIKTIDLDLIFSSINAELDQELNYGISVDSSISILNFFLKLKAAKFYLIYLQTINKIENFESRDILGFNSNLINQISSCLAAEYLKINFLSIASILPPDVVGLTKGLPYLRNIIFFEAHSKTIKLQKEKLNRPLSENSASTFWSKRFASFYLNDFEDTLRRGLAKITLHIDDIFNNFSSLFFLIRSFKIIKYNVISSKIIFN